MNRIDVMGGQPIIITPRTPILEACCGCSLVHLVFYRIRRVKGKQVIERTCYRDDWETKIVRERK